MSEISNTSGTLSVETLSSTTPSASTTPSSATPETTASVPVSDSVSIGSLNASAIPPETASAATAGSDDPLVQAALALEEILPGGEFPPNTSLRIEQDEESGRFIYQSIDNETGEVVRQFPPEDILEILALFRDPEGVIFDDLA